MFLEGVTAQGPDFDNMLLSDPGGALGAPAANLAMIGLIKAMRDEYE